MSGNQGRFSWYELMSTDPTAGLEFYKNLIGWGSTLWEGETHYEMFTRGETPIAGAMQLPPEAQEAGAPTHWLGYVHADDLDATLAAVKTHGGTIMHQMDLPDVGRIGIFSDPQGAVLAAFEPANELPPEHDPGVGEFSWNELITTDYESGFDFYSTVFGWELLEDMDMGEAGIYRMYGRNGKPLGGMFNKPPEIPVACWNYYVRVPSCHDAAEKIAELGGKVVNGPREVAGGDMILQAMDPQGGMFALHHRASAEEASN